MSMMTQQEKAQAIRDDLTICWDGVDEHDNESGFSYHLTVLSDGVVVGLGAVWYDGVQYVASHGFGQTRLDVGIAISKARAECEIMVLAALYDKLNG
mgnify:FL=1